MNEFSVQTFSQNAKLFPENQNLMLDKNTFEIKIAFITGSGTGLGKNFAMQFCKLSARLFITSRKEHMLRQAAQEIEVKTVGRIAFYASDIRKVEQVETSLNECVRIFGDLPSLIINNAGNFISPSERLSPNAVKTIVDIVLLGALNVTLVIGKRLIKEGKSEKIKGYNS
jgi:2,4-dienoyl-CoA reductase